MKGEFTGGALQLLLNYPDSQGRTVYMCLNSDCFYCETILRIEDISWKDLWSSEVQDLIMVPHCPSCGEVMWEERE